MSFIKLDAVSKQVKKQTLINNVTLKINKGDIATFEGINGSGKTLILKAILGLIKTNGTILINNQQINIQDTYPIRAGILIENPSLIEKLTAFQNLKLLAQLQDEISDDDIKELLTLLGLEENIHRKIKYFSLGMKQKVGIAQALLGNNELIVLDEPTNALDEESIDLLVRIIREFKSNQTTFLITSHDSNFINQVSTRPFVVRNGAINEKIS
ncbi:ABC transporter, ATP-binding protein [Companilactobacillus tucceti DSM 20183]|uniref:ABC transporter, ATP-binding protein n=1 Tax=Companilactobacillus tucceti DSM 20183 TaxID=1423811 RepID=A0A0R1JBU8_9LACO|nr:ATP-binding cassette domain-containing protein [Companilactobacillus tucceti]KRK65796.1 ABC transporter, ATP-binding protein [Companilactobacillus tucceti DSM 20183]